MNGPWAEWIAVQLEALGYSTVLRAWDFRPGSDFVHQMQETTRSAGRTIAVLSPAYFGSRFGEAEWRAAFVKDPSGELGLLVPVRVQPCAPPGLLASRVYVDLVDVDEATARTRLLSGVAPQANRPITAPYPGRPSGTAGGPERFPGLGPQVSNLAARNRNFAGRAELLDRLHARLLAGSPAAVLPTEAVHGLGGVGKTQLALEYAHRFRSDYELIWWVPADRPTSVVAALANLAGRLGVPQVADQTQMVEALFGQLRGRSRWLLIYDNAERPEHLTGLLPPAGDGHVLVTSRWAAWGAQAAPLPLGVLARAESLQFLRRRTGHQDQEGLDQLAELLGDLPLALEEAAAYLEQTQDALPAYLDLVRRRGRELFGLGTPTGDEHTDQRRVATVWSVSLDRVRAEAPAAEALLNLCAFLAPELPRDLPTKQPELLPDQLATAVGDHLSYNKVLAAVRRYSLATVTPGTIALHRLVQAVIQARLTSDDERLWAETAVNLLRASFPIDSWETQIWATCERLLSHLLAAAGHAQRLHVAGEAAGWLLDRASTYLRGRGQYRQAKPIAEQALTIARATLDPNHPEVAWRHDGLGRVLRSLGELAPARQQSEQALAIGEATLGPNHPDMGLRRNNLGLVLQDLGDLTGARQQLDQALTIGEATLGPNHPDMGLRRNNLGLVLQDLGDLTGARQQFEQALTITEATLGPNHPLWTPCVTTSAGCSRNWKPIYDAANGRPRPNFVISRLIPEAAPEAGGLAAPKVATPSLSVGSRLARTDDLPVAMRTATLAGRLR